MNHITPKIKHIAGRYRVFIYNRMFFFTWKDLLDVVDLISIPDLNINHLYNEFCDLKVFYELIIQTDDKLKEQVNTFIEKQHEHINSSASQMMSETENDTSDDENMTHKSRQTSDTPI